jgi:ABC-type nitrate/sulfonate/bicarbonate transport system permease component
VTSSPGMPSGIEPASAVTAAAESMESSGRDRNGAAPSAAIGRASHGRITAALHRSRAARALAQLALLAVVLMIYSLALAASPSAAGLLPTLGQITSAFGTLIGSAQFWDALEATTVAGGSALLLSMLIGGIAGILLSVHENAYRSVSFVVDFFRTVPPIALISVGLLLFGPTARMEIILIVTAAVWPVLIQVHFGVANIDQKLLETARSFRIASWRRQCFVVVPAIGPSFATALRLTATLCLLLAVATELLGSGRGLGYLIGYYQQANRVPEAFALVIVVGLVGVILNAGLLAMERRLFAWHHRPRQGGIS